MQLEVECKLDKSGTEIFRKSKNNAKKILTLLCTNCREPIVCFQITTRKTTPKRTTNCQTIIFT